MSIENKVEYMTPNGPVLISLEDLEEIKAKIREEERELCCKDVCYYCKTGPQAELRQDGFYPAAFEHHIEMSPLKPGKYIWQPCAANATHQRAARNKRKEQTNP